MAPLLFWSALEVGCGWVESPLVPVVPLVLWSDAVVWPSACDEDGVEDCVAACALAWLLAASAFGVATTAASVNAEKVTTRPRRTAADRCCGDMANPFLQRVALHAAAGSVSPLAPRNGRRPVLRC